MEEDGQLFTCKLSGNSFMLWLGYGLLTDLEGDVMDVLSGEGIKAIEAKMAEKKGGHENVEIEDIEEGVLLQVLTGDDIKAFLIHNRKQGPVRLAELISKYRIKGGSWIDMPTDPDERALFIRRRLDYKDGAEIAMYVREYLREATLGLQKEGESKASSISRGKKAEGKPRA